MEHNSNTIAKNTLFLYMRMILLMLVSLYTSRVILNNLGVEDYGIYNVVGGVVSMFAMISASLSSAISRFLTYELGRGTTENLNRVFSSSVSIQLGLGLLIILIAETLGLWFVNTKLVIPADRMLAANICFQLSLLTFVVNLISVPYNAAIIAHEKMSAFAYIGILEGVGQLVIAALLVYSPIDNLVFYGVLLCALAVFVRFVYGYYCKRNFEECHYIAIFDVELLKKMFGFAGWNMIGTCSAVLRDQGNNILLNIFFGPVVNSAQAIAQKVNTAVSGFIQNFMVALNPQITKSYAAGDTEYMFKLAFQGGRLSYYMLLLMSLPIILNAPFILELWLKIVPEHTVVFVQLILILAMCESLSHTLVTTILANGNIKKYMIVVGGFQLLNVPINVLLLYMGAKPLIIYIVAIAISQVCLASRLIILRQMMNLDIRIFLRTVYFNVLYVTILASILPIVVKVLVGSGWLSLFVVTAVSILSVSVVELYIGCKTEERKLVFSKVRSFMGRK